MTYLTVSKLRQDPWIRDRVAACVALLGGAEDPLVWVFSHDWTLATQNGWAEAWEASTSDSPGADPSAITDAMILTAVQAILTSETSPES